MIRLNLLREQQHAMRMQRVDRRVRIAFISTLGSLAIGAVISGAHLYSNSVHRAERLRNTELVLEDPIAEDIQKPQCKGEARKAAGMYRDGIARSNKFQIDKSIRFIEDNANGSNGASFRANLQACLTQDRDLIAILQPVLRSNTVTEASILKNVETAVLDAKTNEGKETARKRFGSGFLDALSRLNKKATEEKHEEKHPGIIALFGIIATLGGAIIHVITQRVRNEHIH